MATYSMQPRPVSAVRIAVALGGVGALTFVMAEVAPVNQSTAGFMYLILVLAVATLGGFVEASITSFAAMLCYNYFFLPPVGRFTVADPENWVALGTFLVTALVASHLSGVAQREAAEARRRQQETEQLYSLSRAILLADPAHSMGSHGAQQIARIFDVPAVVLLDGASGLTFHGGAEEIAGIEAQLQQVVLQGHAVQDAVHDVRIWPVSLGGQPIGALAVKGIGVSDGAVQALLNLVAISLERVRNEEAAKRAEVARESEEFKSTLLDAIAHEFKTPLTSIKAAAGTLLVGQEELGPVGRELTQIIDEETDRLSLLVTEAVKMAQMEAGKLQLERSRVGVGRLVELAAGRFNGRGEERIVRGAAGESVYVDVEMVALALRQLIENALKYSPEGSPVKITAEERETSVVIRVADEGPGVPEKERERVFAKFYRGESVRKRQPGTGLGLPIAREIARAHGGGLWVEAGEPGGAVFCLELPYE